MARIQLLVRDGYLSKIKIARESNVRVIGENRLLEAIDSGFFVDCNGKVAVGLVAETAEEDERVWMVCHIFRSRYRWQTQPPHVFAINQLCKRDILSGHFTCDRCADENWMKPRGKPYCTSAQKLKE